jgi:hypothetical protein
VLFFERERERERERELVTLNVALDEKPLIVAYRNAGTQARALRKALEH